ncbi:NADH-quinone oxidoreductase subunit L [Candidatus Cloacimonadota bacterium]
MIDFRLLILMPIIVGFLMLILPEILKTLKSIFTLVISAYTFYLAFQIFTGPVGSFGMECMIFPALNESLQMNIDGLSKLIVLFIGFFGVLYAVYSMAYVTREKKLYNYYSYYLITLGSSFGAALADNFLVFIFFWGILGLTLYMLIKSYDEESSSAAKKALILIGASDSILIFGIGILFKLTSSFSMSSIGNMGILTNNAVANIAFLSLLVASLTKAGAIPFHTWIPDYVKSAPASSSAFLPASLDKLLGIYFLVRICTNLFKLTSWSTLTLLIIGGVTIIAAVMMALVQHNYKKLLGYHAVSQVGYMITGIALGSPLGIAAGLFHMINNAIYKGGLFLTAGSVESRTGKSELDELGGLSKLMPLTFVAALIFALSISGVPPFNGFYSKWMIYQGIVNFGSQGGGIANKLWVLWLTLAVLGSALTLASFIKLISGIFLGRRNEKMKNVREVSILMWLPQILLAVICIVFGVFTASWVFPRLFNFEPITNGLNFADMWQSQTISLMILISLVVGLIIYLIGSIKNHRTSDSFVGGEKLQDELSYSPIEFYKSISNFKILSFFYDKAKKKWFDIYEIFKVIILYFNKIFSSAHSGFLPRYVLWFIAGMLILLIILIF